MQPRVRAVILVGLTGGIGSGKTTVSSALAARGAVVVDADAIVHDLQRPGQPVFDAMVTRFGPGIVRPDGTLDRPAVAAIVFNDKDALADLGGIVHPHVTTEIIRRVEECRETDQVVVLDIPLLAESGWEGIIGSSVVDLPTEVAVERLVAHRGFNRDDAEARIANQASREDRVASASFVIDNSGTIDDLAAQLDACWEWIEGHRSA